MVDPVANEAVSNVAKSQRPSGEANEPTGSVSESGAASFQEVLDGARGADDAAAAEELERESRARGVERADLEETDGLQSEGTSERRPVKLEEFVQGISDDKQEIDRMLETSLNGGTLEQKELLEMQALIYSYSKKVELTSKVVEKGTGGLKQMMQMRV